MTFPVWSVRPATGGRRLWCVLESGGHIAFRSHSNSNRLIHPAQVPCITEGLVYSIDGCTECGFGFFSTASAASSCTQCPVRATTKEMTCR